MTAVDALADIADAETVIFFVLFCGVVYRSSRNVTVQYIKLAYMYRRCYFEMGGGSDMKRKVKNTILVVLVLAIALGAVVFFFYSWFMR